MKNISFIAMAVLICVSPLSAQQVWKADVSHTAIQFKVRHMVFSDVTGRFNEFDLTAKTKSLDDFTNGDVTLKIQAKSIFTNNEMRDNHLRSDDFLNAEKYPEIIFKSTSFKKTADKKYKLAGTLTIRDVTKPIELDAELYGIGKDMQGKKTIAGFHVSGSINRFDFGVKFNKVMEAGGFVVGETIRFDMDVELIAQ